MPITTIPRQFSWRFVSVASLLLLCAGAHMAYAQKPKVLKSSAWYAYNAWAIHSGGLPNHLQTEHFDRQGRLIRKEYGASQATFAAEIFEYNERGQETLRCKVDQGGTRSDFIRKKYDEQGRHTETSYEHIPGKEVVYQRNAYQGQQLWRTYNFSENPPGLSYFTEFAYDQQGHLVMETMVNADSSSKALRVRYGPGPAEGQWQKTSFGHANGRMNSQEVFASDKMDVPVYSIWVDTAGKLIQKKVFLTGPGGKILVDSFIDYTYNRWFTNQWTYDQYGNVIKKEGRSDARSPYDRDEFIERTTFDSAGHISSIILANQTKGNATTKHYQYNALGQCIKYTVPLAGTADDIVEMYTYDEKGRLSTVAKPIVYQLGHEMWQGLTIWPPNGEKPGQEQKKQPEFRYDTLTFRHFYNAQDSLIGIYKEGVPPPVPSGGMPGSPSWYIGYDSWFRIAGSRWNLDTLDTLDTDQMGDTTRQFYHYRYQGLDVWRSEEHVAGKLMRIREYNAQNELLLEYDPLKWKGGFLVAEQLFRYSEQGGEVLREAYSFRDYGWIDAGRKHYRDGLLLEHELGLQESNNRRTYTYNKQRQLIKEVFTFSQFQTIVENTYDGQGRIASSMEFDHRGNLNRERAWTYLADGSSECRVLPAVQIGISEYQLSYW